MRRQGRYVSSQPDYILAREGDRGRFRKVVVRSPRHHDSDHRAGVASIYAGDGKKLARYRRCRSRFPIRLQRHATRTDMETTFEELQTSVEAPPPRTKAENAWSSDATWKLVDERAKLRKVGGLSGLGLRQYNRVVKKSLKQDRAQRAKDVGEVIERNLQKGNLKEAWRKLKGWYSAVEEKAPKPCRLSMKKQTAERAALYGKVDPPG